MSVDIYEDKLCSRDGIHLMYRAWFPEDVHFAAVIVHGAGEHLEMYDHLGFRLSQNQFACITFDLRGFGRSEGKVGHVTCFDDYLNDVDQLIQFFKQKMGNVRVYLVGHSLGGLIATRYAQNWPDRVDGIVLSAPALAFRFNIPRLANWIIRFFSRYAPSLSVNPQQITEKIKQNPRLDFAVKLAAHRYFGIELKDFIPLQYSFRWVKELIVHAEEAMRHVENVSVPTFCLCGEKDQLVHPGVIRSFFDRLKVTEKEWVLFPNLGHCLLHAKQPAVDVLINWLYKQAFK